MIVWRYEDRAKGKGFTVYDGNRFDENGHDEWKNQALRKNESV